MKDLEKYMAVKSFKMNKLIRDKTPDQMLDIGIVMHNKVMDKEEFIQKLKDKLQEECREVSQSSTPDELAEELADVLEIVHTLSAFWISPSNKSKRNALKSAGKRAATKADYLITMWISRKTTPPSTI